MSIIGIIPDYDEKSQCYTVHTHYIEAIHKAGATPCILPYHDEETYLSLCSGFLFIGGGFTLDPALFKEPLQSPLPLNPTRSTFELSFFAKVFAQKTPLLGICAGAQLMNVALGGSLIQHIPTTHPSSVLHSVGSGMHPAHRVEIVSGTLLSDIAKGQTSFVVNTSHVQAIGNLGENVIVNARADDGIIEGIEVTDHPFCLGTQWHPERPVCALDPLIFSSFIKASVAHHMKKAA